MLVIQGFAASQAVRHCAAWIEGISLVTGILSCSPPMSPLCGLLLMLLLVVLFVVQEPGVGVDPTPTVPLTQEELFGSSE